MRGPIDYIIVGFENAQFDGSILAALSDAIDKGIIKVLALSLISKDTSGMVTILDVNQLRDEVAVNFVQKYGVSSDSITTDDTDEVAEILNEGEAAGLLVVEQLWAKPFKQAVINANGYLIAEGRIHPEAVAEIEEE
ncbi:conserved hypothetical protein [sediment metagenome]|uniref:Uncharacterized protein n=1 Tax=sediment metagenome TaxID=749907 RepID=D9PLA6_9ZZZZ